MRRIALCVCLCLLAVVPRAEADTILFGTSSLANGANSFPFGGGIAPPSTRYQQVYDNALFLAVVSGPIAITAITFFHTVAPGGNFVTNTYTFSLSTSVNPVNALDTSNLQSNVGSDSALFGSFARSGALPAPTFTFSGNPFVYNPAGGDLLLDITTPVGFPQSGSFADAMNGTFGTASSRAHNFDSGFEGFGLVTQFTFTPVPAEIPEPGTIMLTGIGVAGLIRRARRSRRGAGSRAA